MLNVSLWVTRTSDVGIGMFLDRPSTEWRGLKESVWYRLTRVFAIIQCQTQNLSLETATKTCPKVTIHSAQNSIIESGAKEQSCCKFPCLHFPPRPKSSTGLT
jgi:hypothetical protein